MLSMIFIVVVTVACASRLTYRDIFPSSLDLSVARLYVKLCCLGNARVLFAMKLESLFHLISL